MPMNIGPMELIIVLVIALIVLGPKRLPQAGRSLGKGMREFKDSLTGDSRDSVVHSSESDDTAIHHSLPTGTTVAEPVAAARIPDAD